MRGRDLIERYVYAVIRRLPANKRTEAEKNLRARIDEQIRNANYTEKQADFTTTVAAPEAESEVESLTTTEAETFTTADAAPEAESEVESLTATEAKTFTTADAATTAEPEVETLTSTEAETFTTADAATTAEPVTEVDQIHNIKIASDRDPSENEVREILTGMGNPADLATEYRGRERMLIGPALYDTYILVLKIVLLAVGVGLMIASVIQLASGDIDSGASVQGQIGMAFASIIGSIWNGMLASFAMVTLIFALVEHYSDNSDLGKMQSDFSGERDAWSPDSLPQVPANKLRIKKSDPIIAIIFSLIFLIIINFMPEIFGLYRQGTNGFHITGFLGEGFMRYLLLINISIVLGIVLETMKLAFGRWNWLQLAAGLMQNAYSFVVTMLVINEPDFINQQFIIDVNRYLNDAGVNISANWASHFVTALFVIVIFGYVVDTLTIASKAFYLRTGKL